MKKISDGALIIGTAISCFVTALVITASTVYDIRDELKRVEKESADKDAKLFQYLVDHENRIINMQAVGWAHSQVLEQHHTKDLLKHMKEANEDAKKRKAIVFGTPTDGPVVIHDGGGGDTPDAGEAAEVTNATRLE